MLTRLNYLQPDYPNFSKCAQDNAHDWTPQVQNLSQNAYVQVQNVNKCLDNKTNFRKYKESMC